MGAGTDADVSIHIFGDDGQLTDLQLKHSGDAGDLFETGRLNRFVFENVKSIGNVNYR